MELEKQVSSRELSQRLTRGQAYYRANRVVLLEKHRAYRIANPEKQKERRRVYNWNSKIRALTAYGGRCACCGLEEPKFLAIDHIDGEGNKHRRTLKTMTIYTWLRKNNYPSGFRVLCHNCNMAIAFWKLCPHNI